MKKFAATLTVLFLVLYLSACNIETYEDGYEDGYANGYTEGYYEGIAEALDDISFYVEDDLWSLACDIEDEYGMSPDEAVMILSNYADVPDDVTEEEVNKAIWAIYRYYNKSHEIINSIEDYWID